MPLPPPFTSMKPGPLRNLYLAIAVLVLLTIVISPVLTVWTIRRDATRIVSDSLQGLATSSLATMQMSEGFLDTTRAVSGHGMTGTDLAASLEARSRDTDAHYASHRETLQTDRERAAFDRLTACKDDYRATRKAVVDLLIAGKAREASNLFDSQCVPKFQTYAHALGDVVENNAAEARAGGAEIIRLCHVLLVVQALLLVFFFVYGFFVPLTAFLERLTRNPIVVRK
ncbi:MCP four helix bundle domain-containing protein [Luteolibacter arcticus]|uniref:MCP four helix bundle domain-containing protein n=1 Tax=Luteolibacter arcticus TaxID=1581411 RepID=A0ABT3GSU4_9BACT|nr:MCP four helix bundle domain-containing protein [Luteolibacter arcticus]MCW1926590.1 MCP four helix bundle domain-containing protein [Luteolibacter arcticus]